MSALVDAPIKHVVILDEWQVSPAPGWEAGWEHVACCALAHCPDLVQPEPPVFDPDEWWPELCY